MRTNPWIGDDNPELRTRAESFALGFVVLGITYLNLRKNVGEWVRVKAMPAEMVGMTAGAWFDLGYLLLALTLLGLLVRHTRKPLAIVPSSLLGRGQLLYVVLLWWLVVGNFERALVAFAAQRLVTEGVIFVVALVCTVLLLCGSPPDAGGDCRRSDEPARPPLARTVWVGLLAAAVSILVDWAIVRGIYGDRFAGHARMHIRFGPDATINRPRGSLR